MIFVANWPILEYFVLAVIKLLFQKVKFATIIIKIKILKVKIPLEGVCPSGTVKWVNFMIKKSKVYKKIFLRLEYYRYGYKSSYTK